MPVTSSEYRLGHAQKDGRRYVRELHQLDNGEVVEREYGPVGEIDYAAVAAGKAAQIEAEVAAGAAAELQEVEAAAAREKVAAVLVEAEKSGAISKEELSLAGHELKAAEAKGG